MKSIKQKIGRFLPVGILCIIYGCALMVIPFFLPSDSGNSSITHIGGSGGSITIVSNINWFAVLFFICSAIFISFGIAFILIWFLFKDNRIEIENGVITCHTMRKDKTFSISDVESCKSDRNSILIKSKFEEKPTRITFVKNAHEIASYINKSMEGHD